MRTTEMRRKLIEETMRVQSRHRIVRMVNFCTHVQCSCGAIVKRDDWNRHVAEIIVDRSGIVENNIEIIDTKEES